MFTCRVPSPDRPGTNTSVYSANSLSTFLSPPRLKFFSIKPGQYFLLCFKSLKRLRLEALYAAIDRVVSALEKLQFKMGRTS